MRGVKHAYGRAKNLTMKAVERMRAKLSSCEAACRGFARPDSMANDEDVRDQAGGSTGVLGRRARDGARARCVGARCGVGGRGVRLFDRGQ